MMQEETRAESKVTFEQVLRRVILVAQGTMGEAKPTKAATAAAAASRDEPRSAAAAELAPQQRLRQTLENLEPEMALKVRTLMIAGRDGQDIASVRLNMTLEDSEAAFAAAARDASENGPLLADYLRRGHALACAAAIDLERPIAGWVSTSAVTLDERAWLSFGRQLANSEPDEWQFLGCVEPGGQEITRLYVRLPDHAWWSFQSVLDRPSSASVTKETKGLSSRRSKGVMASSLKALVARLAAASAGNTGSSSRSAAPKRTAVQGRALRRAARAIRARVGHIVPLVSEAS